MRSFIGIALIGMLLVLGACSNTRFLAEDELLYTGQKKINVSGEPEDMPAATSRQILRSGSAQKPNNSVFNRRVLPPVGLWTYNYTKKEERTKFGNWIYNSMSAPPVLVSDINPELQAQKIENDLFDQGYFQARAWSRVDTSTRNARKAMVEYSVEVGPSYNYRQVEIDSALLEIDSLLQVDKFREQIKAGDQFDVRKLTEARSGIAAQFQDLGYYYLNQDLIELNADTAVGNNQLDLNITAVTGLPESVLSTYRIGQVVVYLSKSTDSVAAAPASFRYKDLLFYSQGDLLKPAVIYDAVYLRPGDLFTRTARQRTTLRLNNLGVFSYVRINYMPSVRDSLSDVLDVRIDLILADQINFFLETDFVIKSTGFVGPGVTVGVSNSNALGGAEKFQVELKGGIEWQWGASEASQIGTFSYEFGINSSLTFPDLKLPWKHSGYRHLLNKETTITLNFDILNRTEYYSMFSALTSLKYSWGRTQAIRHSYSPAYLNSVSLLQTTPVFDSIVEENIYIQRSFEEQFILGMRYEFNYDDTYKNRPSNFYISLGASTSGNLLDLIARIGEEESGRPYEVINTVYSQHVKLTTDFRYYLNGYDKSLVLRF